MTPATRTSSRTLFSTTNAPSTTWRPLSSRQWVCRACTAKRCKRARSEVRIEAVLAEFIAPFFCGGRPIIGFLANSADLSRHMRRDGVAGRVVAPLQSAGHQLVQALAVRRGVAAWLQVLQNAACPLRHLSRLGIGCTYQRGGCRGIAVVEPVRGFARQAAVERINASVFLEALVLAQNQRCA